MAYCFPFSKCILSQSPCLVSSFKEPQGKDLKVREEEREEKRRERRERRRG